LPKGIGGFEFDGIAPNPLQSDQRVNVATLRYLLAAILILSKEGEKR